MRRKEDPIRDKLRAEREQCRNWLEILCQGIGRQFKTMAGCGEPEDIRQLIRCVNTDVLAAVEAAEAADKGFEPYWRQRRVVRGRTQRHEVSVRNPKPKKAGKVT